MHNMNERYLQQELLDMSFEQSKYAKSERLNMKIKPDDIVPEPPTYGWNNAEKIAQASMQSDAIEMDSWIPNKSPKENPFKDAIEANTEGVVRQQLITYKRRNGYLVRETLNRVFVPDVENDCIQSRETTVLCEL